MANQKERIIIETVDNTTRGMRSAQNSLNAFDRTLRRVQTTMLGFVGINIAGNTILGLARLSDKAIELDAKLKIMTSSVKDFAFASKELTLLSRETGSALGENITLFTRINPALRAMGEETKTAIDLTRILAQSLRLSGASQQESASTVRQFSQAMASGVLRGEEFNALMENSPVLMKALSTALGVSIGELRAMSKEGTLTSKVVVDALKTQKEAIEEMHSKLPQTIGRAWTNVTNSALNYFKTLNEGNSKVARFINSVADNFERLVEIAGRVAAAFAVVYGARILGGLKRKIDGVREEIAVNKAATASTLEKAAASEALMIKEAQIARVRSAVVVANARMAASEAASAKAAAARAVVAVRAEGLVLNAKLASAEVSQSIAAAGLVAMRQSTTSANAIAASEKRVAAAKKVTATATAAITANTTALTAARVKLTGATELLNKSTARAVLLGREHTVVVAAAVAVQGRLATAATATGAALAFAGRMAARFWALLTGPIGISLLIIYEIANAFFDLGKIARQTGSWIADKWHKLTLSAHGYKVKQDQIAMAEKKAAALAKENADAKKENYADLAAKQKAEKEQLEEIATAYETLGVKASDAAAEVIKIDDSAEQAALALKKLQKSALEAFDKIADSGKESAENIKSAFAAALDNTVNRAGLQALLATVSRLESSLQITATAAAAMRSAITDKMPAAISSTKDLSKAVKELGVDVKNFGKGYSEAGKKAVAAIETMSTASKASLLGLGKDAEQSAEIIAAAFENGIATAESLKGLEAMKTALRKMGAEDILGPEAVLALFEKIDLKMAEVAEQTGALSEALSESLDDLGVSVDAVTTGISDAGREAIADFARVADEIDTVGLSAEDAAEVIYRSFTSALKKVSTEQGVAKLKDRLIKLGQQGRITGEQLAEGFALIAEKVGDDTVAAIDEVGDSVEETDEKIVDLKKALDKFDDAPEQSKTVEMLNKIKVAAEHAFDEGIISAKEYADTLDEVERRLKKIEDASNDVRTVTVTFEKLFNTTGEAAKRAGEAYNKVIAETNRLQEGQVALMVNVRRMFDAAGQAGREAVVAYQRMQQAIGNVNAKTDQLVDGTGASIDQLEVYAATLRRAARQSDEYGQVAASALERVTSKIDQMRSAAESATSEVASLQAELLTAQGDETAAAELRHKQRVLDMEAKLAEAQAEGNAAQADAYAQALVVLSQIGIAQRKNRTEERAAREAEAAADAVSSVAATTPETAPKPKIKTGSLNVTSASDLTNAVAAGIGQLGALENFLSNIGATGETVRGITTREAGETITVDLKVGDVTSTGTFIKNEDTMSMLEELRLAGATT